MNGPERSTTIEVMTTTLAVSAIFSASSYQNRSSGDMGGTKVRYARLAHKEGQGQQTELQKLFFPFETYLDRGPAFDGLIDHAIALGEFEKLIELVLRRVGIDVEAEPDLRETDR